MATAVRQRPPQMVDLALEYARQGFAVFPLSPNTKVPLKDSHGVSEATTDEARICAWWSEHPRANIAFAGGDGLVFIDRDTYKIGCADLTDWVLPPTQAVRSASGGTHLYFHYDGILPCVPEGKIAPGICIKATGGYVVAPGSVVDGKRYEWVDEHQPIAELPERVAEMIRNATVRPEAVQPPRHVQSEHTLHNDDDAGAYWLNKAQARTCDGQGDAIGFWLAQQLHIEARHGASVDVKATLRDYAAAATVNPRKPFTERDVERWYTSAERSRIGQTGTPARSRLYIVPPPSGGEATPEPEPENVQMLRARIVDLEAMVAERDARVASLEDANERLTRQIDELREYKRSRDEAEERRQTIYSLPYKRLSLAHKAVLDKASCLVMSAESRGRALEDGRIRFPVGDTARQLGTTPDTVSRAMKYGAEMGFWQYTTDERPTYEPDPEDPDKGRFVRHSYVLPRVEIIKHPTLAVAMADEAQKSERNHGGDRRCPECGSEDSKVVKVRTTRVCKNCHAEWETEKVIQQVAASDDEATATGECEEVIQQVAASENGIYLMPQVAASPYRQVSAARARQEYALYAWAKAHDWGKLAYVGSTPLGGDAETWGDSIRKASDADIALAYATISARAAS